MYDQCSTAQRYPIARSRRHHLIAGKSRFAACGNGLLQQNRHQAAEHSHRRLWQISGAKLTKHACCCSAGLVDRNTPGWGELGAYRGIKHCKVRPVPLIIRRCSYLASLRPDASRARKSLRGTFPDVVMGRSGPQ